MVIFNKIWFNYCKTNLCSSEPKNKYLELSTQYITFSTISLWVCLRLTLDTIPGRTSLVLTMANEIITETKNTTHWAKDQLAQHLLVVVGEVHDHAENFNNVKFSAKSTDFVKIIKHWIIMISILETQIGNKIRMSKTKNQF